jgi:hypothetical protein
MARLNWTVFCERAVVDSSSNNLTLIGVLEEIHFQKPTVDIIKAAAGRTLSIPVKCALVAHWERSKENKAEPVCEMLIRLFDPKNVQQLEARQFIDLKTGKRARLIANIDSLPVTTPGRYAWRVYLGSDKKGWKPVGEAAYLVGFVESPAEIEQLNKSARKQARRI